MLKRFCLWFAVFSLFLVLLPGKAFGAVDFPNTSTNGLLGFAGNAKNEKGISKASTTGGKNGQIVYIQSVNDLKTHIGGSTPKILVLQNDLSASSKTTVTIGSNKTLVGSYAKKKLKNIYLTTSSGSGNVIFQNLTFEHSPQINGNNDIQLYLDSGFNYWIDHVTFSGHSYSASGSDLDKLVYVGKSADYITISNSKFANHKYGLILGYPDDSHHQYDGYPHMTIANNYFENLYVRGPGLMRYGYFHVKNNYSNNFNQAITIATKARIYSEYNYFGKGSEKGGILDDKGTGYFKDIGSYPSLNKQTSPLTSWNPGSNYSYRVQTPQYTKEFVTKYAGSQSTTLVFGY